RVAIKSPDFVTRRCVVGAQPTISSAEEHLHAPVDVGRHGAGPGAVQHPVSCSDGAPDHPSRVFVYRDQTWSARRRDTRMPFVLAVGGTDHEQITKGQHVAVAGFMWKDPQG